MTCLRAAIEHLLDARLRPSVGTWGKAWRERREAFEASGDVADLVPNYISANSGELERLTELRDDLVSRFMSDATAIWEFGCGSGYHLIDMAVKGEKRPLMGFDYSIEALKCISAANRRLGLDIGDRFFDLREAIPTYTIAPGTAVLTSGSLEQVGTDYRHFVEYMLRSKPLVVVNIEPLYELYDESDLFDWMAAEYTRRRDYLRGYLPYLQQLEREGPVEILEVKRGFVFLNHIGHSHVVWRPA